MTDFATFGAPKTASVFGTAVASTPFSLAGGKAAFGGMQRGAGRSAFDEEDEDDDDGRQKVELREDSISLDQVCDYFFILSADDFSTTTIFHPHRPDELLCRARGEVHGSDFFVRLSNFTQLAVIIKLEVGE